ncbi:MAG: putative 4-hydroxybenzoate polyprenyltransferase [Fimbriimonadaceae bacterium]|nr:MAG: putative 4-hydroxybenzoate polyprenyltransferase [Fimbriimonadaceae bacterium]
MATTVTGWRGFRTYLEMIKIEHSIFALPFAMIGMMWASWTKSGSIWPGGWIFSWIVVAMVSCRSAAMAWNRIADRDIDALNPRTQIRAIPAGLLSLRTANLYFYGSVLIFLLAAAMLNNLSLYLAPVALLVTLGYSMTKRFTPLCHYVLGSGLGIAPAAAWVAVRGDVTWPVVALTGAVMLWAAGFDIIYALQDEKFDADNGLRSLPQTLGTSKALMVSRISHVLALLLLALAVWLMGTGWLGWLGVAFAGCLLAYEQSLVKPNDLSKVNLAFFTLNGFISIGVFVFLLLDWVILR